MAKDGGSGWVTAGFVFLAGAGIYQVAKSIHSANEEKRWVEFEKKELAEYEEFLAEEAARKKEEEQRRFEEKKVYAPCRIHGLHSEQCLADSTWHGHENRCIECNGGIGDWNARWCQSCEDYYDSINSDDD